MDDGKEKSIVEAFQAAIAEVQRLTQRVHDLEVLLSEVSPNSVNLLRKRQLVRSRIERMPQSGHGVNLVEAPEELGPHIDIQMVTMRSTTAEERSERSRKRFERFSTEIGVGATG